MLLFFLTTLSSHNRIEMDDKRIDFASIVTTSKFLKRQQENEKRNLRSAPALWGVQTSTSWHENELSQQYFFRLVSFWLSFEGRGYTTELTSIAVKVSIDNEQISESKRKLRWSNYCVAATDRFLNSFSHKQKAENWISNTWSFISLFGEIYLQYICYFGSISLFFLLRTLEIWECILNV